MISFVACPPPQHRLLQPRCTAGSASTDNTPSPPRRPRKSASKQSQAAIILMRHGQTDWNLSGRVQGGLDKSRLNTNGMLQARRAGRWLRNLEFDSIFCSPLTRARDTLRLARDASGNRDLQNKKAEVLESLKEIQVPWQGLQKKDIPNSLFSKAYMQYAKNPPRFSYNGFSPLLDVIRRAKDVWDTLERSSGSCNLVVSHNQMNKALICAALDLPTVLSAWRQGNCCFNVFILEAGMPPRLRLCNGADHVSDMFQGRRDRVRRGCMRVFIHQQGGSSSLQRVIGKREVSDFYLIGDSSRGNLEQLGVDDLNERCTVLPFPCKENVTAYDSAVQILNKIRASHEQKCVVISVSDSYTHRAFFAASIGLGKHGIDRLVSDTGGVSTVEIRVADPVGRAVTYVEGYNVGAWHSSDALLSYTRVQPSR